MDENQRSPAVVITEILEMNHRSRQWKVSPQAVTANAGL